MKYLIAILPIFIMLTLAPALMAVPNNAYAQNKAIQSISQIQGATQLGICLSGIDTFISCNNLNLQNQINTGSNALAQDGGNGKYSGNSAVQAIGQEQSSDQVAVCISAEGTFLSCNNLNLQNQINTGSNLALQNGGNGKYSGNSAVQAIGQEQSSSQRSLVLSGGDIGLSGNNLNVQNQINTGSNALAQDGGNGKGSGNSAAQGIGQSQSSSQRSQCVSGGDVSDSCNNLSFQNQVNTGSNAAAQSGGNGKGSGNSAAQGIGQSQSSSQNAQCVSGEDAIVSCNNVEFQNQVNSGSNALAQFGLDNNGNQGGARHGSNGEGSGNSAAQGIGQSQSSNQRSGVLSAGNSFLSGNNLNLQNQVNEGDNLALQSGGYGGGNTLAQGIGQSQDSNQRSSVVTGESSIGSGNNINIQNQENNGDNLAAQSSEGNGDNTENAGAQSLAQSQGTEDDAGDDNGGDSSDGDTTKAQTANTESDEGDDNGDNGSSDDSGSSDDGGDDGGDEGASEE